MFGTGFNNTFATSQGRQPQPNYNTSRNSNSQNPFGDTNATAFRKPSNAFKANSTGSSSVNRPTQPAPFSSSATAHSSTNNPFKRQQAHQPAASNPFVSAMNAESALRSPSASHSFGGSTATTKHRSGSPVKIGAAFKAASHSHGMGASDHTQRRESNPKSNFPHEASSRASYAKQAGAVSSTAAKPSGSVALQAVCRVCSATFPSFDELKRHLKAEGHFDVPGSRVGMPSDIEHKPPVGAVSFVTSSQTKKLPNKSELISKKTTSIPIKTQQSPRPASSEVEASDGVASTRGSLFTRLTSQLKSNSHDASHNREKSTRSKATHSMYIQQNERFKLIGDENEDEDSVESRHEDDDTYGEDDFAADEDMEADVDEDEEATEDEDALQVSESHNSDTEEESEVVKVGAMRQARVETPRLFLSTSPITRKTAPVLESDGHADESDLPMSGTEGDLQLAYSDTDQEQVNGFSAKSLTSKKQLLKLHDCSGTAMSSCEDMCPEEERLKRVNESDVHRIELLLAAQYKGEHSQASEAEALRSVMIKKFQRSSADHVLQIPRLIRTPKAILATLEFIEDRIMNITSRNPDQTALQRLEQYGGLPSELNVYLFVWDRFRMVAKDFILQQSSGAGSSSLTPVWVECHERIARWFVLMDHHMTFNDDFASGHAQQNAERLNDFLKTLHGYYFRSNVNFDMPNRAEFVCYFIIIQLGNRGEVSKFLQRLPDEVLNANEIRFALQIWGALKTDNYAKFFRLLRQSTLLQGCLMFRYVGEVRLVAIRQLLRTQHSKGLPPTKYPLADLVQLLMFESLPEAVEFVEHCGIQVVTDTGVGFAGNAYVLLDREHVIEEHMPTDKNDRPILPITRSMRHWIEDFKSTKSDCNEEYTTAEVCRGLTSNAATNNLDSGSVTAPNFLAKPKSAAPISVVEISESSHLEGASPEPSQSVSALRQRLLEKKQMKIGISSSAVNGSKDAGPIPSSTSTRELDSVGVLSSSRQSSNSKSFMSLPDANSYDPFGPTEEVGDGNVSTTSPAAATLPSALTNTFARDPSAQQTPKTVAANQKPESKKELELKSIPNSRTTPVFSYSPALVAQPKAVATENVANRAGDVASVPKPAFGGTEKSSTFPMFAPPSLQSQRHDSLLGSSHVQRTDRRHAQSVPPTRTVVEDEPRQSTRFIPAVVSEPPLPSPIRTEPFFNAWFDAVTDETGNASNVDQRKRKQIGQSLTASADQDEARLEADVNRMAKKMKQFRKRTAEKRQRSLLSKCFRAWTEFISATMSRSAAKILRVRFMLWNCLYRRRVNERSKLAGDIMSMEIGASESRANNGMQQRDRPPELEIAKIPASQLLASRRSSKEPIDLSAVAATLFDVQTSHLHNQIGRPIRPSTLEDLSTPADARSVELFFKIAICSTAPVSGLIIGDQINLVRDQIRSILSDFVALKRSAGILNEHLGNLNNIPSEVSKVEVERIVKQELLRKPIPIRQIMQVRKTFRTSGLLNFSVVDAADVGKECLDARPNLLDDAAKGTQGVLLILSKHDIETAPDSFYRAIAKLLFPSKSISAVVPIALIVDADLYSTGLSHQELHIDNSTGELRVIQKNESVEFDSAMQQYVEFVVQSAVERIANACVAHGLRSANDQQGVIIAAIKSLSLTNRQNNHRRLLQAALAKLALHALPMPTLRRNSLHDLFSACVMASLEASSSVVVANSMSQIVQATFARTISQFNEAIRQSVLIPFKRTLQLKQFVYPGHPAPEFIRCRLGSSMSDIDLVPSEWPVESSHNDALSVIYTSLLLAQLPDFQPPDPNILDEDFDLLEMMFGRYLQQLRDFPQMMCSQLQFDFNAVFHELRAPPGRMRRHDHALDCLATYERTVDGVAWSLEQLVNAAHLFSDDLDAYVQKLGALMIAVIEMRLQLLLSVVESLIEPVPANLYLVWSDGAPQLALTSQSTAFRGQPHQHVHHSASTVNSVPAEEAIRPQKRSFASLRTTRSQRSSPKSLLDTGVQSNKKAKSDMQDQVYDDEEKLQIDQPWHSPLLQAISEEKMQNQKLRTFLHKEIKQTADDSNVDCSNENLCDSSNLLADSVLPIGDTAGSALVQQYRRERESFMEMMRKASL